MSCAKKNNLTAGDNNQTNNRYKEAPISLISKSSVVAVELQMSINKN